MTNTLSFATLPTPCYQAKEPGDARETQGIPIKQKAKCTSRGIFNRHVDRKLDLWDELWLTLILRIPPESSCLQLAIGFIPWSACNAFDNHMCPLQASEKILRNLFPKLVARVRGFELLLKKEIIAIGMSSLAHLERYWVRKMCVCMANVAYITKRTCKNVSIDVESTGQPPILRASMASVYLCVQPTIFSRICFLTRGLSHRWAHWCHFYIPSRACP